MLHARWIARNDSSKLKLGEWNVGRWGVWINLWAMAFTCWAMIFLPFPSTMPVTATNMHYSGLVMGLVLLVALVSWFARARQHWRVPNGEIIDIVLAKSQA